MGEDEQKSPKREYPPLYERAVPIFLLMIAAAIVLLLAISLAVIFGLIPGLQ